MAGGAGERFWPLSRQTKPKQLLPLGSSDKTMIEEAIERISPLIAPEDIFIITGVHLLEPIREIVGVLPPENIIAEPLKRNTAPCLALGAAFIAEKYSNLKESEISISVLTADQFIYPNEKFIETVDNALNYIEKSDALATIGIPPSRPETGYGYIELDKPFENEKIKNIVRFREKPNYETALNFLQTGKYLWNSGMFFWRLDTFINAINESSPEIGAGIDKMRTALKTKTNLAPKTAFEGLINVFETYPNISIDYALMEKTDKAVVAKALFNWDDVGSWDALERTKQTDENQNVIIGDVIALNSKNSIFANYSDNLTLTAYGLDNISIIAHSDSILVLPKDKAQETKKIVEALKASGRNEKL